MPTEDPPKESNPNAFICGCEENMRQACAGEGFYKEKEGKRYCVLHYPSDEKAANFQTALKKKLSMEEYNFRGVWFPKGVKFNEHKWSRDTDFSYAIFNGEIYFRDVEFRVKALFKNASFNASVYFIRAEFSKGADFSEARFAEDAYFSDATFGKEPKSGPKSGEDVKFDKEADCSEARFYEVAEFRSAIFSAKAHFNGARFNAEAYFSSATFSLNADFSSARFRAFAHFIDARFGAPANFTSATFCRYANFHSARFSGGADFEFARFCAEADFSAAGFSAIADFKFAIFSAVADFEKATFENYVYFAGESQKRTFSDQTRISFQPAHIEKPERVSFHTLDLKPGWFVNVDPRKFEFTKVEFKYDLKDELESLTKAEENDPHQKAEVDAPHRLLSIACQRLADNAENNSRYHEASRLRHSSFEVLRIEKFHGFVPWRLDWWYWLASGYGESVRRAFIVFVLLIGIFALGYKNSDFDPESKTAITKPAPAATGSSPDIPDTQPRRLGWREAALYSFNVSILQKPEPKPRGLWGGGLVSLETVLGPAQAALLALALRRRFMR